MKKSNKYSSILVFLMLLIGVGYAILQANLQINGIAKIGANQWNVHFQNVVVNFIMILSHNKN